MHAAWDHAGVAGEAPALGALRTPVVYLCDRCNADLTLVSAGARFCPQCGTRLAERRPAAETGDGDGFPPGSGPLPPPLPGSSPKPATFTSMIVRGYANAMYRLGVRYEVRHNEAEAVRCYGKASHLGNEPAQTRLHDIPLAKRADAPAPLRTT
jgi:DNA-directed RNA polymerase subunit RPC12/RpoP